MAFHANLARERKHENIRESHRACHVDVSWTQTQMINDGKREPKNYMGILRFLRCCESDPATRVKQQRVDPEVFCVRPFWVSQKTHKKTKDVLLRTSLRPSLRCSLSLSLSALLSSLCASSVCPSSVSRHPYLQSMLLLRVPTSCLCPGSVPLFASSPHGTKRKIWTLLFRPFFLFRFASFSVSAWWMLPLFCAETTQNDTQTLNPMQKKDVLTPSAAHPILLLPARV